MDVEDVMLPISKRQAPVLLRVSCSSRNEPRQTLPKLPLSAMAVASFGKP